MDFFTRKKRIVGGGTLWYSLNGYSDANVLGAWKFKGRNSSSDALKDLSNNGRTLTNSGCAWSSANGFYVDGSHYLDHSSLRSTGWIKSLVMKISGGWGGNYHCLSGNWGGISLWQKMPFETASFAWHYEGGGVAHGAGLSVDSTVGSNKIARENVRNGPELIAGVIGFSNSGWGLLYNNGSAMSLRNATATSGSYQGPWTRWQSEQVAIPRLVGGSGEVNNVVMNGYFYITALAAYDVVLSQAQHEKIYKQMLEI